MPGATFFEQFGSKSVKPTRFAPIFINRHFTGLYTQRNPLRDPSDAVWEKFYGGRPDALLAGVNVELTNRLTLARRPGLSRFSATTYPTAPDFFYSFRKATGTIDVMVDTIATLFVDNQDGTKTTVLTKSAGAGQSQMQGVGSTLFIGDGVDVQKWNDFGPLLPGNNNGNGINPTWNWGIAAPLVIPGVTITPAASAATAWQANTVFSTMGLMVDANGNIQQLISVNATGTNNTQFGTTGNGEPNWNQAAGTTTTEATGTPITWTNQSTVSAWTPLTLFRNFSAAATATPCYVYDPITKNVYGNSNPGLASGTTGNVRPNFIPIPGQFTSDGSIKWACSGIPTRWVAGHVYAAYSGSGGVNSIVVEPYSLPPLAGQPLFVMSDGAGGTAGTGGTNPPWATTTGSLTRDNQLIWVNLGSATRTNLTPYIAWTGQGQLLFSAIKDGANNLQVCVQGGTSAAAPPTFSTGYGSQTTDGSVIWVCVGPAGPAWSASTIWHLPSVGFSPPQSSSPYGGSSVVDSGNNLEFVTISGKSGGAAPAWAAVGATTVDNTITWTNVAAFVQSMLKWTSGHNYAFSFKARVSGDSYNTTPPPGWPTPLGTPTGSGSGGVSTASPVFAITGPNAGAVNTISSLGSLDPQVDTIVIWRDADGGGSSNMFFLTEIPNPAPIGGVAQSWNFQDTLPDTALNTFIAAPINHENDPPPAGFLPDTYHFGRIWGHAGNTIYYSGGPDTLVGNGNETFPPTNTFSFPSSIARSVATATGLLVFTTSDVYIVAGGPQTTTFFTQPLLPGTGLLSFNALDVQGGRIFLLTSDRQFVGIDPSAGESEMGFPVGDQLATFDPALAYVTAHIAGSADKAVYVSDGSTGWFRLNPNQAPQSGPVWSTKAAVVGGCKAVQSIEIAPGVHKLLVGGTGANQPILMRDLTAFADNGSAYPANFTMGSLILAQPGQLAELGFVTLELTRTGTAPTVGFLLDEISGAFTNFLASNVSDPPELYGATGAPATLFSNRYYFNSTKAGNATPPPAWCRHMQMKIDYGNVDIVQNELLTLTIFGAHYQEK
jgi:hypothetical protein